MKRRVKIDGQGRITIPRAIREASGLDSGSELIAEFDYDTGSITLRSKINPFDVLALDAIRQYEAGETISLDEIRKAEGIKPEE